MTDTFTDDAARFRAIVERRRAVRKFDGERVPEAIVRDCLELAILAPNSSNLQPWEFYWVRDDAVRARLAEACLGQNAAATAGELIAVVARTKTWRAHGKAVLERWPDEKMPSIVRTYYEKVSPFIYSQGPFGLFGYFKQVLFWFLGWFRPVPREPFSPGAMRTWAVKSAALAAENLMLAFSAHGYDTCPMEGFDRKRVKKLLRLPRDAQVLMVVAAGRSKEGGVYNTRFRLDLDEVLHEI